MFSLESGEVSDNWILCKSGYVNKIETSEGFESVCMKKIQDTPTCENNFEKLAITHSQLMKEKK